MLQILFALLAGVLTIAAPCILPLLPILLGTSIGQTSKSRPLFIVLGFVLVFSMVALFISFLTQHLGLNPNTLRIIAIIVLAIFGLFMIWPVPFELLTAKLNGMFQCAGSVNIPGKTPSQKGNLQGFLLGMTLGLVWTPCAGPVLGSVLTLVATQKNLLTAGILLIAYSVGAGVPMLVIAYGGQYVTSRVRIIARYSRVLQLVFGVLIILLAIALYFNYDTKIYTYFLQFYPSLNPPL